jgi:hypothetical protein
LYRPPPNRAHTLSHAAQSFELRANCSWSKQNGVTHCSHARHPALHALRPRVPYTQRHRHTHPYTFHLHLSMPRFDANVRGHGRPRTFSISRGTRQTRAIRIALESEICTPEREETRCFATAASAVQVSLPSSVGLCAMPLLHCAAGASCLLYLARQRHHRLGSTTDCEEGYVDEDSLNQNLKSQSRRPKAAAHVE